MYFERARLASRSMPQISSNPLITTSLASVYQGIHYCSLPIKLHHNASTLIPNPRPIYPLLQIGGHTYQPALQLSRCINSPDR